MLSNRDHTCQLLAGGAAQWQGPTEQLAGQGHIPEGAAVGGPRELSQALQCSVSAE